MSIEFPTEQEARRFERYLKSGSGRAFAKRDFGSREGCATLTSKAKTVPLLNSDGGRRRHHDAVAKTFAQNIHKAGRTLLDNRRLCVRTRVYTVGIVRAAGANPFFWAPLFGPPAGVP